MNPSRALCVSLAFCLHPLLSAHAAPGGLDLSFGAGTGVATTDIATQGDDNAQGVAVQIDGKIISAGYANTGSKYDFAVVRYDAAGVLDPSFGGDGKVTTAIGSGDDVGRCVVLQSDGKIVVGGRSPGSLATGLDFALVRYLPDGTLDLSFGGTGKVTTDIGGSDDTMTGIALQSDGRIVAAGFSFNGSVYDFAVARYNPDGSLDPTFNNTGKIITTGIGGAYEQRASVVVQSDGRIVVAGPSDTGSTQSIALVRYEADGSPDLTFNDAGKVTTATGPTGSLYHQTYALALQPDGKIVAAGTADDGSIYSCVVLRYRADGTLDPGFGGTGKVVTAVLGIDDEATAVVVQPDGKIVVAGSSSNGFFIEYAVVRYNPDGSLDSTFGGSGKVTSPIGGGGLGSAVALQNDGKIIVAGNRFNGDFDFGMLRFEGTALVGGVLAGPIINPLNAHVYYLLSEDSWTNSESRAQALGGHLATINDAVENQWVFDTFAHVGGVARDLWIGLNDAALEGTFVWADGEPLSYTNWSSAQPSDSGGVEDFGHIDVQTMFITPMQWNDLANSISGVSGVVEIAAPVPVANTGGDVPNVPGTTFVDFGSPAIDGGRVGGAATILDGRLKSQVIYGAAGGAVVARTGQPGPDNTTFTALGDPVFGGEAVGFSGIARVNAEVIPAFLLDLRFGLADLARFSAPRPGSKLTGLFSRVSISAAVKQLARQGGTAPGIVGGGQFTRFPAFGLPRNRPGLVFGGNLRRGAGVTRANDFGVWREKAAGGDSDLLLRNGDMVATRQVQKLEVMIPVANASDQRRSLAPDGGVMAAATFAGGGAGLVRVAADGSKDVALDRESPVPDLDGAKFDRFSAPATRSGGGYAAFIRLLSGLGGVTPQTNGAIYLSGPLRTILRRGDPVTGHPDQRFQQLGQPLLGQSGLVGFLAALSGHGVSPRNRTAIVQHRSGKTSVVARLGDPAPECGPDVTYRRFQSVVVTDTAQGQIVFTGIVGGKSVNARNSHGLWSVSATGEVKLLLRSDQLIKIDTATPKVRLFESLQARRASNAQGRSTDATGFVTARVKLDDGRSGVLRIPLP
jgi:uncharacterized delta-60 repeat protein